MGKNLSKRLPRTTSEVFIKREGSQIQILATVDASELDDNNDNTGGCCPSSKSHSVADFINQSDLISSFLGSSSPPDLPNFNVNVTVTTCSSSTQTEETSMTSRQRQTSSDEKIWDENESAAMQQSQSASPSPLVHVIFPTKNNMQNVHDQPRPNPYSDSEEEEEDDGTMLTTYGSSDRFSIPDPAIHPTRHYCRPHLTPRPTRFNFIASPPSQPSTNAALPPRSQRTKLNRPIGTNVSLNLCKNQVVPKSHHHDERQEFKQVLEKQEGARRTGDGDRVGAQTVENSPPSFLELTRFRGHGGQGDIQSIKSDPSSVSILHQPHQTQTQPEEFIVGMAMKVSPSNIPRPPTRSNIDSDIDRGMTDRPGKTYTVTPTTPTTEGDKQHESEPEKKKLVVRGLKKYIASRGGHTHPPQWVRDFPIKSKFHIDNYLCGDEISTSTTIKPSPQIGNSYNMSPSPSSKRSGRCDACGIYSVDTCRCCKKCQYDCSCPTPPKEIPQLSQAFGPGWVQAQKVICELAEGRSQQTRDEKRAPIGRKAYHENIIHRQRQEDPPHLKCHIDVFNPSRTLPPPLSCYPYPCKSEMPISPYPSPCPPQYASYYPPQATYLPPSYYPPQQPIYYPPLPQMFHQPTPPLPFYPSPYPQEPPQNYYR